MEIYLLRHGEAVQLGASGEAADFDRPLTPEGKRVVRCVARAMRAMQLQFDSILTSPFVRAQQTAEIVAKTLKAQRIVVVANELGSTPAQTTHRALINRIRQLKPPPASVLVVGHEPYLSRLAAVLLSGDAATAIELKKAGLCKLSLESLRYGRCARLEWLLTPAQMALMAG